LNCWRSSLLACQKRTNTEAGAANMRINRVGNTVFWPTSKMPTACSMPVGLGTGTPYTPRDPVC
jgi:hypothetical protein